MAYPVIQTERMTLRGFKMSDALVLKELAGEFAIADTTLSIPHPYQEEDAIRWISQRNKWYKTHQAVPFAITLNEKKLLVGGISLMNISAEHKRAELGYWIGKPFWNNGYATEASRALLKFGFEELQLNKIHAHHFSRNPASGKILLKIGMSHEGALKQHIIKWGNFEDIEMYGILKSDFFTR
jgi:RimJ/RimL family protein N-acetyltransferase